MSKINAYSLKRPIKKVVQYKITSDVNPEEVIFIMKEPTITTVVKIEELQQHYKDLYLTPNKDGETFQLPFVDNEPIEATEALITMAATLYGLQFAPDNQSYSFEEICVLFATMEEGMGSLMVIAGEWMERYQSMLENPTYAVAIPL